MSLPYEALRTFLAVAETESFSLAARRLGVSQPWVSQRVAHLEKYLSGKRGEPGFVLFERRRSGAILTPEGCLLRDITSGPLEAMEQLEDIFHSSRGSLSGRVRFSAADMVLRFILPGALLRFRQRYPQVRVKTCMTYSPLMVAQVLEDNVDFAVGDPGDSVPATVRAEVIKSCDRLLVVSKRDPLLKLPQPVNARQLRHRDWIVLPQHSLSHRKLDALLGHYSIAMEVESWEVMKTYIALGIGIGLMPELCLVPQDHRRLRTIRLAPEFGRNHFAIVLRKRKVLSPAALALIDVISPGLAQRLAK